MKPTLNASGRLEDGGHDRGKKASKLLDATTAFSSIVYGGSGALRTGTATLQDIFVLCLSSHISPNVCMADIKPSP